VGLIEHLLVLYNLLVAPVKNPSVAIGTTKPSLQSSFFFQLTIVSSLFSIAFLPSIKIFFKGICDGQSWIYAVRSTIYGVRSMIYEVRSTIYEVRSTIYGVRNMIYGVRSTIYEVRSTIYGVRSMICGIRSMIYGVRSTIYSLSSSTQCDSIQISV